MTRVPLIALTVMCLLAPLAAARQNAPPAPVRVGGNVAPPKKTRDVPPVYPPEAQQAHVQGVVIIEATIGEDGKVRDARVLRSIPLLDQAAIDAVRQWEFTPTLVNGVPVPVVMTVTVNFSMPGGPGPTVVPSPDMILLGVNQTADGFAGVFQIDRARANALPRWNPETDSPLLSIADVTRLARESVMQRNTGASRYDLENVTLRKSVRPAAPTFWFYTVTFATGPTGDPRQVLSAVILPDGTVVEPSPVESTVPPR